MYNVGEIEVLAEWLTLELAPVIYGSKPATILSLCDTRVIKLLTYWNQYGRQILGFSAVKFMELLAKPGTKTIFFYRHDILAQCLAGKEQQEFLLNMGYPVNDGLEKCLEVLKLRYQQSCPHEVGLLLGIPLKDVAGFMGISDKKLTFSKDWHVYGQPEPSLAIMKQFAADRQYVANCFKAGWSAYQILQKSTEQSLQAAAV